MGIALFDFDGTITKHDSMMQFIRFATGDFRTFSGLLLLSPMLLLYKLKLIPNYKAKQQMLAWFFKGMDENKFKKIAGEFSLNHIDGMVRAEAMEKIRWHKEQGHRVVVVSASMECWVKPWCDKQGLELIATRLEIKQHKLTGRFATPNCYGPEKAVRIKEKYDLTNYEIIYAYGDSRGDKEMLALAHHRFYKKFR